jgi:TetR/AcrR family tetracycline transcriptional repressor
VITKVAERTDLSRAAIVDRALTIADAEGLDAVTIRRLGQELGVTPMALYWHVKNKEELLDAMGDRLFDEMVIDAAAGPSWHEKLRAVVETLLSALRAHPSVRDLAFRRVLVCDAGRELTEITLANLREAGFDVTTAADIARHAMQTAVMLVDIEGDAEPGAAEVRAALLDTKRRTLAGLPVDRYPHLVEAADALTACEDLEGYYRFGVDLFITGVRAQHSALRRGRAQSQS